MAKRGDPRGDDPLACYEWGVHIGQELALARTASWAGLVPLLQDVHDYLIELAVERAAREELDGPDLGDEFGLAPAVDSDGRDVEPLVQAHSVSD